MALNSIPYSGKLSREKTFADFAVLELSAKVFSAKFWGRGVLGVGRQANVLLKSLSCVLAETRPAQWVTLHNI